MKFLIIQDYISECHTQEDMACALISIIMMNFIIPLLFLMSTLSPLQPPAPQEDKAKFLLLFPVQTFPPAFIWESQPVLLELNFRSHWVLAILLELEAFRPVEKGLSIKGTPFWAQVTLVSTTGIRGDTWLIINNKWGLSWAKLSRAGVKPGVGLNRLS